MNSKHFELNTKGLDFFVGDLHGCYDKFQQKLKYIGFDPETDRMFSVGDLIDRGPDSVKCLKLLEEPWFHAVLGNHEDFLLGSHTNYVWVSNGGGWSWDCTEKQLEELRQLVRDKMYQTITVDTVYGKVGVVHAESTDDWNDNGDLSRQTNLWARTRIKCGQDMPIKNIDRVVVGHTPLKEVVRLGNMVYIDTGAVFDGQLTILTPDDIFVRNFKRVGL